MVKNQRKFKIDRIFLLKTSLFFLIQGLAFQHHKLGWLTIPGMAGIWWSFQNWENPRFIRTIWFSSLVYFALVWSWLLSIDPSRWSPLHGIASKLFIIFVWIMVVLIFSTPMYFVARIWKKFQCKNKGLVFYKSLLLFSSLWILQELARSYFFAFVMWGDGSSLSPHWNFGTLGIAMTSIKPILPLASSIGMYGLSIIVILFGVLFYQFLSHDKNKLVIYLLLGLFVFGYASNIISLKLGAEIKVAAVNTSSPSINYDKFYPTQESDIMVLPEYSLIFSDIDDGTPKEVKQDFIKQSTHEDSVIITSRDVVSNTSANKNYLLHLSSDGTSIAEQEKTFIITGGEYLAYWFEVFYKRVKPSGLTEYNLTRKVSPGDSPEMPVDTKYARIGSYACSGVISPELYRHMARNNAQILTNSASLTIFEGAESYHQQTEGFAIFHAVANQKPFVQSTKMGKGLIIDHNGNITQRTTTQEDKLIEDTVNLTNSKTIYTRFGEIFIYLAIAYVIYMYFSKIRSTK